MPVELAISLCHRPFKNSVMILASTAIAGLNTFFGIAYARSLHYEDSYIGSKAAAKVDT